MFNGNIMEMGKYNWPEIQIRLYQKSDQSKYYDLTNALADTSWGGDYQQVARRLEFNILNPVTDTQVTHSADNYVIIPEIGDHIIMFLDGEEIFKGHVWQREQSSKEQFTKITCYDWLIYLIKAQVSKIYKNMTPEAITAALCDQFGLPKGDIISTGIKRDYVALGQQAYDVIMAAYTYASKQNGKKYMPLFYNEKLNIIEKGAKKMNIMLDSGYNLIDSTFTEDLDDMVNRVIIYDDKGNTVLVKENAEWEKLYGTLQAAIQYDEGKDNDKAAQNTLKYMKREAKVTAFGNPQAITGNSVMIKDPHTNLIGVFYIDADTHSFKDNSYTMDLTLHFDCIMDEKDMQDKLDESSSSSSGGNTKGEQVVSYAKQFLGVPYVRAGESPSGFDCSGLTMYVYSHFGVTLPHNAAAQQGYGSTASSPEPGDLIFFGNPASHVGIYVSDNQYIYAPHTGDVVKIGSCSGYSNARRLI